MKELFQLFISFGKVGTFVLGGGYAMLPMIRHEVLVARKWIKEQELLDLVAVSQALPGAFAVNLAIIIGKRRAGFPGALAATLGMVLPAFFSILLLMALLRTVRDNIYVVGALTGIKAVSVALILVTIFQLAQTLRLKVFGWVIALLSFGLIVFLKFNAILVLVGSGAAGFLLFFWAGRKERGDR